LQNSVRGQEPPKCIFGKDHECGSGDILADRQTQRHRQTYSSQYFATTPMGEVIILLGNRL